MGIVSGLTVYQAPFVVAAGDNPQVTPSVLDLGSYNLTLDLSRQASTLLFAPASSANVFGSLQGFIVVATAGSQATAATAAQGTQAYAAAVQLSQQNTPADIYLLELISQPGAPGFTPARFASGLNNPDIAVNTGLSVAQGASAAITANALSTLSNTAADTNVLYSVTGGPSAGHLELSYAPGIAVTAFSQADINQGALKYVSDGSGASSDSFTFTVQNDTGGSAQGTFNIGVTAATGPTVTANETTPAAWASTTTLTTLELNATDPGFSDSNLTYTVTSGTSHGHLELSGQPGVAVTSFTQADIANGRLRYVNDGSYSTADSFVFSVSDGTSTSTGNVFNFSITGVPPPLTDTGATVNEGGTTTITTSQLYARDFGVPDANITYTVGSAPANGYLQLASNPGVAITSFTQADIAAGNLQYVHNGSETTSDAFSFSASDPSGPLASGTFNIKVNPVDDPPVLTTDTGATVHVFSSNSVVLTTSQLSTSDVDTSPSNLTYKVTGGLAHGYLELTTNPGAQITSFTQADLQAGIVEYVHTAVSFTSDNFTFTVQDQTTVLPQSNFTFTMTV